MRKKKRKSGTKRVSRRDWLIAGLEVLRLYGLRGLGAEPLARFMGVTKGSFYHYFTDRQDLHNSLLEFLGE